jgi:hypothetical protein
MLGDEAYPLLLYKPYERASLTEKRISTIACLEQEEPWDVLLEFCILNGVLFRKQ